MVIYKYRVTPGEFSVAMPATSAVVAVHAYGYEARMWASVDPNSPVVTRRFRAVATGEHFEASWKHVGTFHMNDGLVFHLLEMS